MAKVKRSEAAATTQTDPTGAPTEPDTIQETEATPGTSPDNGGITPFTPEPARNETVRTLQMALGVVSVLAVLLAVAVIVLVVRGTGSPTSATDPGTLAAGATSNNGSAAAPAPNPSPTPVFFTKYVAVNPNVKPDAIVLEIHDDYQCPWCARAEQIYGDALAELAESGDIDLRIHIRTLVGDQIIHNDSSERAGIAATCADRVGAFWAYHSTIFANQPEEGVGFTDEQLKTDFAAQAGITGQNLADFLTCYDTSATSDLVTAMEQEGQSGGVRATPTFLVNGLQVNFDLQASGGTPQPISTSDLLAGLKQVANQ